MITDCSFHHLLMLALKAQLVTYLRAAKVEQCDNFPLVSKSRCLLQHAEKTNTEMIIDR